MLSYQHGFHAGNHADVIKHIAWIGVLEHLKKKNKPFTLFDTHSGAGKYQFDDAEMRQNKEFETGISKLGSFSETSSYLLNRYLDVVEPFYKQQCYPGSPVISESSLRDGDTLHLMELHPAEFAKLQRVMKRAHGCHLHKRDGFEGLLALTPPKPNRGAVLIDPPYERFQEYQEVTRAVKKMYEHWQQGIVVIWYPLLSARAGKKQGASEAMYQQLSDLAKTSFVAELIVEDVKDDNGMYGSGVCILNPPWQLDENLQEALQALSAALGEDISTSLRWLKREGE